MQKNDEQAYAEFAQEFAVRFAQTTASLLSESPIVDFDLDTIDTQQMDLLFNLCFFGIAAFEEQSGFFRDEKKFVPRPVFEPVPKKENPSFLIGSIAIHGQVEDDILKEGIERVKTNRVALLDD